MEEELTLEEGFAKLEEIIAKMQEEHVTLEDAFRLYEEGVLTLQACNQKLDLVEKKMLVLNEQGGLEDYDSRSK